MLLFFDTETTGLPKDYKAPISDLNNWPRMVQIAWQLVDDLDNPVESKDYIISPDNYTIPPQSTQVHGITTERAIQEGVPLQRALEEFSEAVDRSNFLIAHNISFDEKIVGAEYLRLGQSIPLETITKICIMKAATNFCKIPGQYGYKWPTLTELHYTLFHKDFEEAHNAQVDVQACANCFYKLRELRIIKI